MFAMVNWCLVVVQGTIWSWVPSGFLSPAIRPMANGGGCPRSLRWGHGGPLGESLVASVPLGWNRAYNGSGAAAHGCWAVGVLSGIAEHTPACKRFIPRRVPSVQRGSSRQ